MKFENISASYDVGIAKEYGLASAVLLNKLIYLSKHTIREDGYCWRTAKELEDELGLTPKQQALAIQKLEEAGIIETKNTYIINTHIKCKHFKITDFDKMVKSDFDKRVKSETNKMVKPLISNNINNINTNIIVKHSNNEKHVYGTYKRIKLTDKEYERLTNEFGKDFIDKQIELLDEYVQSNNNKNKYTDFNLVLRKSIRQNWFKEKQDKQLPSWFGKEIEKEKISDEAERLYQEVFGNDQK